MENFYTTEELKYRCDGVPVVEPETMNTYELQHRYYFEYCSSFRDRDTGHTAVWWGTCPETDEDVKGYVTTDYAVLEGLYNYRFHQAAKFDSLEKAQEYLTLGEEAARAITRKQNFRLKQNPKQPVGLAVSANAVVVDLSGSPPDSTVLKETQTGRVLNYEVSAEYEAQLLARLSSSEPSKNSTTRPEDIPSEADMNCSFSIGSVPEPAMPRQRGRKTVESTKVSRK